MANSKLVRAIQAAVGRIGEDKFFVFTGIVTDNSNALIDNTIEVQQINGLISSEIQTIDPDFTYNQQIPSTSKDEINSQLNAQAGGLIFTVDLQPAPGDWNYFIPSVNSHVIVGYTTFQNPFLISCNDVDFSSSHQTGNKSNTSIIQNNTGSPLSAVGITINTDNAPDTSSSPATSNITMQPGNNTIQSIPTIGSYGVTPTYDATITQTPDSHILNVKTPDGTTTHTQTATDFNFSVNEGASLKLDTKIDINTKNGAEIKADTLITIKNTITDLNTVLQYIVTTLNEMAVATIPTTAPTTLAELNPDILVQITNLTTGLSNLLE